MLVSLLELKDYEPLTSELCGQQSLLSESQLLELRTFHLSQPGVSNQTHVEHRN